MNVKVFIGIQKGGVKITMFNAVTATAEKMAGTACFFGGQTDIFCHVLQVNRFKDLGAEFFLLVDRVAAVQREFFIGARGVVTDQAVYFFLG